MELIDRDSLLSCAALRNIVYTIVQRQHLWHDKLRDIVMIVYPGYECMKLKKQYITIIITAFSGLLTATSGLLGGVVSSQLQQSLRFALPAFALATLISGGLTAWLTLHQEEKENPLDVQEREN